MTQLNCVFLLRQIFISLSSLILDIPNQIKPESCDSKEEKPEVACPSDEAREQVTTQLEQKESSTHSNPRSATDGKVSASKSRNRAGRKLGAKK